MNTQELVFDVINQYLDFCLLPPINRNEIDINTDFSSLSLDETDVCEISMRLEDITREKKIYVALDGPYTTIVDLIIDLDHQLSHPESTRISYSNDSSIDTSNDNIERLASWCEDNAEIFSVAAEDCDDEDTRAKFKRRELMHKEVADVLRALKNNRNV